MNSIDRSSIKVHFGVVVLMSILLFGPAVARADVVLDWNVIAVNTAIANGQNPFAQARYAAITQLAVFEAVNVITRDYEPYLGTIAAPKGASTEAAAIQASYRVLSTYFPGSKPDLDMQRANSLASIPDSQAKSDGIAVGDAAAVAMIVLRANDGSSPNQVKIPGSSTPGEWQGTASCPVVNGVRVGAFFNWQNVRPFGIPSASAFLLDPPPALESTLYARAFNEVKEVGSLYSSSRPEDRAEVVLYYAITSPTHLFNQAARQVAEQQGRSLSENARAFALINMAISDSLVASFLNKYHYNLWRPETAVPAGEVDGNDKTEADTSFVPFIATPCFPSYPSNHGSGAGGGAEALRRLYGEGGHAITLSNPARPGTTLHYTTFNQIVDDISDARVYGGIHFRFDQVAGARLGRAVATSVYKNNLRSLHGKD
jgi:hypothetical protein